MALHQHNTELRMASNISNKARTALNQAVIILTQVITLTPLRALMFHAPCSEMHVMYDVSQRYERVEDCESRNLKFGIRNLEYETQNL